MTRAAFRDLSNTPQRLNVRQQHAAQKPGSGLQPQKQAPQQAAGRWCNALANPSPVFGSSVGSVQLQPSAGSSQGQISRLQLEPNAQHQQSAKDPLSLLAPAPRTSTSPYPNDLQQQQQQFNGALVRDFRRASGVDAPNLRPPNLRSPPSPAESLDATHSALESCIRELDGILPNFSAVSRGIDRSATASPPARTTLSYSPSHVGPADSNASALDVSANVSRQLLTGPVEEEARSSRLPAVPQHMSDANSAGPQPTLARKSAGMSVSPASAHTVHRSSIDSQHDTDKAVATLGDAMIRLQQELSMLGQELRQPAPAVQASPWGKELEGQAPGGEELGVSASLVVWPGSTCKTPRHASKALDATHDSWRILSPGAGSPLARAADQDDASVASSSSLRHKLMVRDAEVKALSTHLRYAAAPCIPGNRPPAAAQV